MKCDKNTMLLYAVTDRAWVGCQSFYEQVEAALKGGVTCVQLREKKLPGGEFLAEAEKMVQLCHSYGVPLIINDNVDVAVKCGADGIHVGQEDMGAGEVRRKAGENMIIGVSVHSVKEAEEAVRNGADYLGLGAVFATTTKTDVEQMSSKTIRAICDAVNIPTVAIGGISAGNLLQLKGSGVDGVAVVSAIFGAPDPQKAAMELLKLSRKMTAYDE